MRLHKIKSRKSELEHYIDAATVAVCKAYSTDTPKKKRVSAKEAEKK